MDKAREDALTDQISNIVTELMLADNVEMLSFMANSALMNIGAVALRAHFDGWNDKLEDARSAVHDLAREVQKQLDEPPKD